MPLLSRTETLAWGVIAWSCCAAALFYLRALGWL
jgi:hypothetical protein